MSTWPDHLNPRRSCLALCSFLTVAEEGLQGSGTVPRSHKGGLGSMEGPSPCIKTELSTVLRGNPQANL